MPETKTDFYTRKIKEYIDKGYDDVCFDASGRLKVRVAESFVETLDLERRRLYRSVWGAEWPVVRSSRADFTRPPKSIIEFVSHRIAGG